MADETPTLRLERGNGPKADGWSRAYLYLGDSADAEVDVELPDAVFTALAAALDPRTTEVLFEQRDTAIERAKAAEDERDELLEAYTSRRPASEAALLQRLRSERDTAIEERDRLELEVRRLEARVAEVDITTLGEADRLLRCSACGHVRTEPR